jgi:hypothetical protein
VRLRYRLLHQDRTPRARRLHAQGRPLVGRRADHHRVCAADRGLDALHRGPRHSDWNRGGIRIPDGDQAQIALGRQNAQHIGHMRVTASQQRDIDWHTHSVPPQADRFTQR